MRNALLRSVRATRVIAVWCATLAGAAMTGGLADAATMSGLNVSLVPINSGSFADGVFTVPVGGNPTPTVFELSIRITGSIPVANQFGAISFGTRFDGSAVSPAVITDIYMSNTTGGAINTTASVIAGAGTLFYVNGYAVDRINNPSNANPVGSLPRDLLIGFSTAYLDDVGTPVAMVGDLTNVEIARLRLALEAGIDSGSFMLGLRATPDLDGFLDPNVGEFGTVYGFTTQNVTLEVVPVPEPATLAVLIPGLIVMGGFGLRRRMSERTISTEAASGSCVA